MTNLPLAERIFNGGGAPTYHTFDGGDDNYTGTQGLHRNGGTGSPPPPTKPPITDPFPEISFFNDGTLFADDTFERKPGTLSAEVSRAVLSDVAANPSRDKEIYTTQDHANSFYVRNPNRLLPSADLTCISPWNSNLANRQTLTPVTPKWCLSPNHYTPPTGATVRFVTLDNEVVERVIVGKTVVSGQVQAIELDSDLPSTIKPAKVMPADWGDYLGDTGSEHVVGFATDQQEKLLSFKITAISPNIVMSNHTRPPLIGFSEAMIGGDSASQMFLVYQNEVILLAGAWFSNLATSFNGPAYHAYLSGIEAITGTLNKLDLSGFINYGS